MLELRYALELEKVAILGAGRGDCRRSWNFILDSVQLLRIVTSRIWLWRRSFWDYLLTPFGAKHASYTIASSNYTTIYKRMVGFYS